MELQFSRSEITYLDEAVSEIQNLEQTQELKLSDGMPDIGSVLASWGQVILRSKEWRSDSILVSGGMMVWVLYSPEDGGNERIIDGWIPFQMKWMLPENTPEGTICVDCRIRFVDSRTVSPRKIMIRAGVLANGKALVKKEEISYFPEHIPEDVAVLKKSCSVLLPQEAGETAFYMDEELSGANGSGAEQLVCYTLKPELTDKKVLGNKLAFRGNLNLHMLYKTESQRIESQDFLLPFSQSAELNRTFGADAEGDITLCATNLELEISTNGQFHVKCGMAAQYRIREKTELETAVDAYSPYRSVNMVTEVLPLPVRLEKSKVNLFGESELPELIQEAVDMYFLPDHPTLEKSGDKTVLESRGPVQILYYNDQGMLRSAVTRWEGRAELSTPEGDSSAGMTWQPADVQLVSSGDRMRFRAELPAEAITFSPEGIPEITALELGDDVEPDVSRPSLILRRAGKDSLWEIAKSSGSMVDAIRNANHLEGEPSEGQMLLIPIS